MNSTPVLFFIEVMGRVGLGDGLLDTPAEEAKFYMIVPDPTRLNSKEAAAITEAFEKLAKRRVIPFTKEVNKEDRRVLDLLVLKALGLPPRVLPGIYAGIVQLIGERLALPQMRASRAASRGELDTEKILTEVIEEILPDGMPDFPGAFWPQGFSERKPGAFKEVNVTGKSLRLGHAMLMQQDLVDQDGQVITCASRAEAEFVMYAARPDSYIVRLPADKFVIEKTVSSYGRYCGELENQFLRKFGERTLNHAEAATLTHRAMEKLSTFASDD